MKKDGTTKSPTNLATSQPPFQFVNYDLTKEDKAALHKMSPTADVVLTELGGLAQEGYKITISWDSYSDCVQAILIGAGKETKNHGFMLSSRAGSVSKCLAALVFKHKNVFEGVWHDKVLTSRPDDDF